MSDGFADNSYVTGNVNVSVLQELSSVLIISVPW